MLSGSFRSSFFLQLYQEGAFLKFCTQYSFPFSNHLQYVS